VNPINNRINWLFQKNKHLLDSLVFRNTSEFVYKAKPSQVQGQIPVFTFHVALPDWFEKQCVHLSENGYRTLGAEDFLLAMGADASPVDGRVVLTFDDGLKQVWTVAYPLLKKYNLKAICFLIPGCISQIDCAIRPTLDDYWQGRATLKELIAFDPGESAFATWKEIQIMHESGLIDFQSHTMVHGLVFTSDEILNFIHPRYDPNFYGNFNVPIYSSRGKDVFPRELILGLPVYRSKPRMAAARRYYDDEGLRDRCVDYVKAKGGEEFFQRRNWRAQLFSYVKEYKNKHKIRDRYETVEERDQEVYEELLMSKRVIEEKLPSQKVTHLCFPWFEAENFAVQQSKKAGYSANYF